MFKLFTHDYECLRCFYRWQEKKGSKQWKLIEYKECEFCKNEPKYKKRRRWHLLNRQISILEHTSLYHLPEVLKNLWKQMGN